MDVIDFVESIKEDYLYFLYQTYKTDFPRCCHQASNILCGYIKIFFDESFSHRCTSRVKFPHSYISNNKGTIIDFTCIQFMSNVGVFKKENLTKSELLNLANECKHFPISSELYRGSHTIDDEEKYNDLFNVRDIPCRYEEDPLVIRNKFNENNFIEYCNKYGKAIGEYIIHYI